MLEIVREFGLEMLTAADETETAGSAMRAIFLGQRHRVHVHFIRTSFQSPGTFVLLAAERDNVRLALVGSKNGANWRRCSPGRFALSAVVRSGTLREGQQWIERALGVRAMPRRACASGRSTRRCHWHCTEAIMFVPQLRSRIWRSHAN